MTITITHRIATILVATSIALAATATPGAAISPKTAIPANPPSSPALSNVIGVAAGAQHTCAVDGAGAATCWGSNASGQLGDGSGADRSLPVPVSGLGGGATAVTAGAGHTCALVTGGGVLCWGLNSSGQVGDGTSITRTTPVSVTGLDSGATAIAAGGGHTCAIVEGGVKCWGKNASGQLGDGSFDDHPAPVTVTGLLTTAIHIATGNVHSCAALIDGSVACWGGNPKGQLGRDSFTQSSAAPLTVPNVSGAVAVAGGQDHSCALLGTGTIKCWGLNSSAQIGLGYLGTDFGYVPPLPVAGIAGGATAIAIGGNHSCAIVSGAAYCWGSNDSGEVGNGKRSLQFVPAQVSGLSSDVLAIAAGSLHTCGVASGNVLKCWGGGKQGQIGTGTAEIQRFPAGVVGLGSGATMVAAGTSHTCAIKIGGALACWGANDYGQLGNGTWTDSAVPVTVSALLPTPVIAVSASSLHTCAVLSGGAVKCWGFNGQGQLGNSSTISSPLPVSVTGLGSGVVGIAVGDIHTCAVLSTGALKCWGDNTVGQLGIGWYGGNYTAPQATMSITPSVASKIAAGSTHTCVTTGAGGAKCWGNGSGGQVGDGSAQLYNPSPVDVAGIFSGSTAIGAGLSHACAIVSGAVQCWGSNASGQIGDGTTQRRTTPVTATGLESGAAGVATLSGQTAHSCAVMTTGAARCWGANAWGQVGDGSLITQTVSVSVVGLDGGVAALSGGQFHTCALMTDGAVKCWGGNSRGQLGNGYFGAPATPQNVGNTLMPRTYLPILGRDQ